MKKFKFNLKDGTTKTMEFDELVRWACLIEALEVVGSQEDVDVDSDPGTGQFKFDNELFEVLND